MKKFKFLSAMLSIILILSTLVGCSSSASSSSSSPSQGAKQLRVALQTQPPTLDPPTTVVTVTSQIASHIFETLLAYDKNSKPQPMLAEKVITSSDGKNFTIHLRKGVKFQNGKEMTSDDVVASLERWKKISSMAKSTFQNVTSIKAFDKYTVEIQLSVPSSLILPALASPIQAAAIMPKEVIDAAGNGEVKEYIGTGPFKFVEWKQDQYIHLSKFDGYQPLTTPASGFAGKKEALVQDLYFYFVKDVSARIAGLQSGSYDFVDSIPTDNFETIKNDKNIQTYVAKPYIMDWIFFNTKARIFSNLKMRQAVNEGVDLDTLIYSAASNKDFYRMDPGLMFQEQTVWHNDAGKGTYNHKDLDKAKALLQEAGYDGKPITILASKEYTNLYNESLALEEQLKKIGFKVDLQVYDWPTFLDKRKNPNSWDIFLTYSTMFQEPFQINYLDGRKNYPGWYNNTQVEQLLDKIALTVDPNQRKEIFRQIQTISYQDIPVIKIGEEFALAAGRKNVKGYDFYMVSTFWNVSVE
ncbi:MAG: ABC transporter substrate-binding protein [Desulfitobacteriaceae bacterium]